jgi:hypothetical protein
MVRPCWHTTCPLCVRQFRSREHRHDVTDVVGLTVGMRTLQPAQRVAVAWGEENGARIKPLAFSVEIFLSTDHGPFVRGNGLPEPTSGLEGVVEQAFTGIDR